MRQAAAADDPARHSFFQNTPSNAASASTRGNGLERPPSTVINVSGGFIHGTGACLQPCINGLADGWTGRPSAAKTGRMLA